MTNITQTFLVLEYRRKSGSRHHVFDSRRNRGKNVYRVDTKEIYSPSGEIVASANVTDQAEVARQADLDLAGFWE